jgi:adenylate cyclase class 2
MELEVKILNIDKEEIINKIKNLFQEIDELLKNEEINFLKRNFKINKLLDIFTLEKQQILGILNSKELNEFINRYKSTPKKWVRLRKTIEKKENKEIKEKTTLTIKHILKDNESNIQQMQETEIEVNSFEETNELLEGLGFSYRSYQEKRREKFILNEHEIDIDTWPKLSPYIEIEGSDKNDIENILNTLGYSFEDTISCTVDEVYKKISLDINNMKELKF